MKYVLSILPTLAIKIVIQMITRACNEIIPSIKKNAPELQ